DSINIFRQMYDRGIELSLFAQTLPLCRYYGWMTRNCQTKEGPNILGTELLDGAVLYLSILYRFIPNWFTRTLLTNYVIVNPNSALQLKDVFIGDLANITDTPASYSLLRLLLPHSPFVLDSNCQFRSEWRNLDGVFHFSHDQTL